MKVYTLKKNGVVTNQWDESTGNETYREPCFGEEGSFTIEISEIQLEPEYKALRRFQYSFRIDPFIPEAVTDLAAGDPSKIQTLLAEKDLIKLELPKP
jgi:hypothetical protein